MAKKLYSPEETSRRFDSLPKAIQDLLYSFEMTSIITKVGEKNGLHIDQMDKLNTETAQVMMGLTETKDFSEVIMEDLEIDRAKADTVVQDINDMLFIKIREAMKQQVSVPRPSEPVAPAKPAPLSTVIPINKTPEPASVAAPTAPATPVASQIPAKATEIHPADMMLTQKTVTTTAAPIAPTQKVEPLGHSTATGEAPKPGEYKADPYRELPI